LVLREERWMLLLLFIAVAGFSCSPQNQNAKLPSHNEEIPQLTPVFYPQNSGPSQGSSSTAANVAISPASGYLRVDGIRIRYLEWGHMGPAVILLHGMNDNAQVWNQVAPMLASNCHVIAPDRRGSGESDKPKEGYDFGTLISDVAILAERLKLRHVTLVGHSFGAEVALNVAAQRPQLIHSVILVDGGFWPKRVVDLGISSSAIEKTSNGYNPELLYPIIRCPVLLVLAHGSGPSEQALAELKKKGIDYLEEARKAEQGVKELADHKLRNSQIVAIENSGHWIQKDQPQALARVIEQFLRF
jgi:pimeloyl-ACP methyl ester carboxylesterase